jgi:hypothetical protein
LTVRGIKPKTCQEEEKEGREGGEEEEEEMQKINLCWGFHICPSLCLSPNLDYYLSQKLFVVQNISTEFKTGARITQSDYGMKAGVRFQAGAR